VKIQTKRGDGSPYTIQVSRPDGHTARLVRGDEGERQLPLPRRELGDLLAEELRRMDPDFVYGEALAAATGSEGLNDRSTARAHKWQDPAWSDRAS
jgi:glucose-6-phosphate dehydrogenase assembly protein OpcA